MTKKKRLAIIAGCMMLYSNWWAPAARAEDQDNVAVEEVEVTDTKLKERKPEQVTTITADDIKAQGAQNAADVLKNVPGLAVSANNTSGKTTVAIRGSDANNTKVFIDGVPLSPVDNGVVDLSNIPTDSIEKIEVIKGAVPVQYGSDASGGVIYITTKKGTQNGGAFSAAVGSWNTKTQSASVSGSNKNTNFFFTVKNEQTDGYTANAAKKAEYFNGKMGFDLNPTSSLSIFGSYSKKTEEVPNRYDPNGMLIANPGGGDSSSGHDDWASTFNVRYDPVINWQNGVAYSHKISDNNNLNVTLYQSAESSTMRGSIGDGSAVIDAPSAQTKSGKVRGIQLQDAVKFSPVNTFTFGLNHELRGFSENDSNWQILSSGAVSTNPTYAWAQYSYTANGYFAQDTIKLGRLTTNLGYRYNEISDNVTSLIHDPSAVSIPLTPVSHDSTYKASDPVASLNYALDDNIAVHASVGKSFRYPQPSEITSVINENFWLTNGNKNMENAIPYLKPEETLNKEVGVSFSGAAGWNADVTIFKKNVTNMIQARADRHNYGIAEYYNLPSVELAGYETEISKKLSPYAKLFFQYTKTRAVDPVTGNQVNDVPKDKFNYGLNYEGRSGVKAYLALSYTGPTTSSFSNSAGTNTSLENQYSNIPLPGYHVVDFKLSKEKTKGREVYVKINNLTDTQYYSGAYLVAPGRYTEFGESWKW